MARDQGTPVGPPQLEPRHAALVLHEARTWQVRGLMSATALARVEEDYGPLAAGADRAQRKDALRAADSPGLGLSILYALAGVLLGASLLVLAFLLKLHIWPETFLLAGSGLTLLAGGVATWRARGSHGVTDTVLIAGLVPLVFAAHTLPTTWPAAIAFALVPLAAAAALPWLRRPGVMVAAASTLGFVVVALRLGEIVADLMEPSGTRASTISSLWAIALVAAAAGVVLAGARRPRREWASIAIFGLTLGLGWPSFSFIDGVAPHVATENQLLILGGVALALLGAGLALRERPIVFAAAVILSVAAIGYGFALSAVAGVFVLVAVAVGLVVLAAQMARAGRPVAPA